ncbi:MAG: tRNA (adenosine(37)-N6)-dimethylallyltransferase MiaA, partial [Anaerolineales bacterium]
LERGLDSKHPVMSAIGYRQLAEHLEGTFSLDEALSRIRRANRALVRHQANWFKPDDPRITWIDGGPGAGERSSKAIAEWFGA